MGQGEGWFLVALCLPMAEEGGKRKGFLLLFHDSLFVFLSFWAMPELTVGI